MRRFIIALQFLTIIPYDKDLKVTEEDLGKSMFFFPLVGLFIGGCLVFSDQVLSSLLPLNVVNGLLITLLVILTGSMHLDALADTIDGIASGGDKTEKLRIMKEGNIGAMGVVGIVIVLMLKYLTLNALPQTLKCQYHSFKRLYFYSYHFSGIPFFLFTVPGKGDFNRRSNLAHVFSL